MVSREEFEKLTIGDTINYHLRAEDCPTDPHQVWSGRVIGIDLSNERVIVAVLDEGYAGAYEYVDWEQMIRVGQLAL